MFQVYVLIVKLSFLLFINMTDYKELFFFDMENIIYESLIKPNYTADIIVRTKTRKYCFMCNNKSYFTLAEKDYCAGCLLDSLKEMTTVDNK